MKNGTTKIINKGGGCGGAYFLVMIGVFIYYFPTINSVSSFLMVAIKTIFWPGFLAYSLYGFIGMQ
jgi:hypothetical protein